MKCYELTMENGDSRFCYPKMDDNSAWSHENLYENEYNKIHELPIPFIVENKYIPYDYLVSDVEIVSKRAFELMKSLNRNITGFESQMFYKNEKIWDIYYTLVVPRYKIFNYNKSIYETDIDYNGNPFVSDIAEKLKSKLL